VPIQVKANLLAMPGSPGINRAFFEVMAKFGSLGLPVEPFIDTVHHLLEWYERLAKQNVDASSVMMGMMDNFDTQFQKQFKKPSKHIKLDFYIEADP
jgi:hypothetical protein